MNEQERSERMSEVIEKYDMIVDINIMCTVKIMYGTYQRMIAIYQNGTRMHM